MSTSIQTSSAQTSPSAAFKAALQRRAPLLGIFVKIPDPGVAEVLAGSGLDCLCLDAEHAPFDRFALDRSLMAARAGGCPALVRIPAADPAYVLNALDLGAAGLLVPHVRSADEAAAVVRAAHYGPGGRGYAGGTRATGYQAPPIADRLAQAQAETSVVVQIEDVEALPHVEAIASTQGVDAVFIGRIDLTVALGESDPKSPLVIAAVEEVMARAKPYTAVGMFTADVSEVPRWRELGASLFLLGSDHGFLRAGAAKLRADTGLERRQA